jgi:hypothetical protein
MTSRAALSPAWLGLFAALSFGGLVVASFASGYHLVMKTPPRSVPAAPTDSPAAPAAELPGDTSAAPSSGVGTAGGGGTGPTETTAADPSEAIVRPNLPPNRALVRNRPESGAVVARLPSNQRVALRGRSGEWLHIAFDRKGRHVDGWTQEANLQLR